MRKNFRFTSSREKYPRFTQTSEKILDLLKLLKNSRFNRNPEKIRDLYKLPKKFKIYSNLQNSNSTKPIMGPKISRYETPLISRNERIHATH